MAMSQSFGMRTLRSTALAAAGALGAAFAWAAPAAAADLSGYDAVYVAPVQVTLQNEGATGAIAYRRNPSAERPVDARDQARNAKEFRETLIRVLSKSRQVVDAPGPGVLTIEATLTKLRSTKPTMADLQAQTSLDYMRSVYAGGAAATVRFSENGKALGEWSDSDYGNFSDGDVRIGVWQDADRAFYSIARGLDRRISKTEA